MSSPISHPLAGPAAAARRMPRLADAALTRARLTVVPRVRSRAPRVPFVLLVSVLLVAGVVGLLMFNTSMQQSSFAASRLEDKAVSLSAQEQALTMEVESLRNAQRVAEQAQAMGMVLPTSSCFLALSGAQPDCPDAPPAQSLQLRPAPPVRPAVLDPAPIVVPAEHDAGGDRHGSHDRKKSDRGKNRQDTGSASPGSGDTRGRNDGKPGRGRSGGSGH